MRKYKIVADGRDDEKFMRLALSQATEAAQHGEMPVGAVIVNAVGEVISTARNECEARFDATAHAEILAIRRAAQAEKNWRLTGCTLYVTLEPCPMCAGAIVISRLSRLVYGATDNRAGAIESAFNIPAHSALASSLAVRAGVLEDECSRILSDFFKLKR